MRSGAGRSNCSAVLVVLSAFLLCSELSGRAAPASPGPAAASAPSASLTGTVRSYDEQTRTLEVITGVGLALRLVKLSCPEGTEVKAEGQVASMARLQRGEIVRVEYRRVPEGNIAKSIEVLPKPGVGGAR